MENQNEQGQEQPKILFEDFLLFEVEKNRQIVTNTLEDKELSLSKKIELLEYWKDQCCDQVKKHPFWGVINDEKRKIILTSLTTLYMSAQTSLTASVENQQNEQLVSRFKEIVSEMSETYERKNHDYGNSFSKSIDDYGVVAGLVRMSDKWNRLNSLLLNNLDRRVNDESVVDTLTDLACYCIMLRMEIETRE